jgi:hypothetical protein
MRILPLALVAIAAGIAPTSARALGPVELEAAVGVGFATNPTGALPGASPVGVSLAARGGVSFHNVYGGVVVAAYYFDQTPSVYENAVQYGVEAGYGFQLRWLTLRPLVADGFVGLRF